MKYLTLEPIATSCATIKCVTSNRETTAYTLTIVAMRYEIDDTDDDTQEDFIHYRPFTCKKCCSFLCFFNVFPIAACHFLIAACH